MSRTNIRYANLKYADNKKAGRNKIMAEPKKRKGAESKYKEPWHLHIIIEATPGETIGQLLVEYFNKKFKEKITVKKVIDRGFFGYAMKQAELARFVLEDRSNSPLRYNFKELYTASYQPQTKTQKAQAEKWFRDCQANRLGNQAGKVHKAPNKYNKTKES